MKSLHKAKQISTQKHGGKNRSSVILYDKIIFNKIEQGLIYILGDLAVEGHVRLLIPGMIISSGEFILSSGSQCPIKMLEKRLL